MDRIYNILKQKDYIAKMVKIEEIEQDRIYCKHGIEHSLDVARAMIKRAKELNFAAANDIIFAAALLHDIGRAVENSKNDHATDSATISLEMLQKSGYNDIEITQILNAIANHSGNCGDDTLAEILYFADKKTRPCYICKAANTCKWPKDKRNNRPY